MKAILPILLSSLLLVTSGCTDDPGPQESPETQDTLTAQASQDFFLMDTPMTITVYAPDQTRAQDALDAAVARIEDLDQNFNPANPQGELGQINSGQKTQFSQDGQIQMETALSYYAQTEGLLHVGLFPVSQAWGFYGNDPQVPSPETLDRLRPATDLAQVQYDPQTGDIHLPFGMALDFGAIGKGYASDQAQAVLEDMGIKSALISLGGNVQTIGHKPDGSPFRIGIQDPRQADGLVAVLPSSDEAVITSGDYQRFFEADGVRYHHILNPETLAPAQTDLASVTIVAPRGIDADALSTSLFTMGKAQASQYWQAQPQAFSLILVDQQGHLTISADLQDRIEVAEGRTVEILEAP